MSTIIFIARDAHRKIPNLNVISRFIFRDFISVSAWKRVYLKISDFNVLHLDVGDLFIFIRVFFRANLNDCLDKSDSIIQ